MADVSMVLEGVPALARALALTDTGTRTRTVAAIRKGTQAVVANAKRRVRTRSGELVSTIRDEYAADGMVGYAKAGFGRLLRRSKSTTGDKSGRYAKAIARRDARRLKVQNAKSSKSALASLDLGVYGPVVEHGDPRRHHLAHPFLKPALRDEKSTIIKDLADAPIAAGKQVGLGYGS